MCKRWQAEGASHIWSQWLLFVGLFGMQGIFLPSRIRRKIPNYQLVEQMQECILIERFNCHSCSHFCGKHLTASTKWTSPPVGFFKVNVDASVVVEQKGVGLGAMIRDSWGKVVAAAMRPSRFQREVVYAKAEAARLRIWNWFSEVVDLVLNMKSTITEHFWIISDDIQSCITRQRQISIQRTPRANNRVAHKV